MNVQTATLAELLAYYNANSGKAPVKRFADRKTAERRVTALLPPPAPVELVPAELTATTQELTVPTKKKNAAKKTAAKKPLDRKALAAAVAESWKDPKVAAARATHTNVRVGGETYRSVREAFRKLGLPDSKHVKFRAELKAAGRLTFEGKIFTTVAAEKTAEA